MAKQPEDFSKIEDKFKLSLMQTDKRIVDLEVALSELSTKINEVKSSEDLKQRIDDIEDLVMVENMGLIELKKLMEEIKSGVKPAEMPDLSGLEQKIANLENMLGALPKPEQVDLSGVHENVKNIDEGLVSLKENHSTLESQITFIVNEINSFRKEVAMEIQNLKTSKPDVAIQFLTSRLEAFKTANDEMQRSLDVMETKLQSLDSKISNVRMLSVPEEVTKKIEGVQRDWLEINSRIDSLESVLKNFYRTHDELQAQLKKFDTFDKASTLKEDLEKKFDEFKFIENEIKRLSNRIEMIYDNIDKRLDKVKDLEKKVPDIFDSIENISKDIDKNKIEILDRVKKDDMDSFRKIVDDTANDLNKFSKDNVGKIWKELSGIKHGLGNQDVEKFAGRIAQLEEWVRQTETQTDQKLLELEEKIAALRSPESPLEDEVKELIERTLLMETKLAVIENVIQESRSAQPIILE